MNNKPTDSSQGESPFDFARRLAREERDAAAAAEARKRLVAALAGRKPADPQRIERSKSVVALRRGAARYARRRK